MTAVASIDARTGKAGEEVGSETSPADIAQITAGAAAAAPWLAAQGRSGRARLLNALADALEAGRPEIVETADRETALGTARLNGELTRTCFQLRFMGEVAQEGSYLAASIEHAGPTGMGPRPDLRLINIPIGPVAVFGASNFPLAFSVPGGDTASALAAGCPVIVKGHTSHARTSVLVADIFRTTLTELDAPEGVFALVFGRDAGTALVRDPRVAAVGFTGSVAGGRALFDAASSRPEPIPFYGELGSVNPLVVTAAAAAARAEEIGAGIAGSMTAGTGQFCTKPGLFLLPSSASGDRVAEGMVSALEQVPPGYLLNEGILAAFRRGSSEAAGLPAVKVLFRRQETDSSRAAVGPNIGRQVEPVLIEVSAADLAAHAEVLTEECFGPFGIVIRYGSADELNQVLAAFPPALTGTLHTSGAEDPELPEAVRALEQRSGRIVFNGYPTGVAVSWSMHHGGQYPAATTAATSVGAGSIQRWVRPLSFQDAPAEVLPPELRDETVPGLPRRIDGKLQIG